MTPDPAHVPAITILATLMLTVAAQASENAPARTTDGRNSYVIVTDAAKSARNPYTEVVEELAKLRKPTAVLHLGAGGLEGVFKELRALKPAYVAFVVRAARIEDNFVGAVFQRMTALDEDPYLDCAYGYITGASPKDALELVRNTARAEAHREQIPRKFVAIAHTFAENDLAPFADEQAKLHEARGFEVAKINPVDNSPTWTRIAEREIQKLNGASLIFLAGHGMGDKSCAIPGNRFSRVKLHSAIVVNGTCHSAVTWTRHDSVDGRWTIRTRRISPRNSVCLNFVKAGAIGQFASTASSSWPNVAFTIDKFFDRGRSLGEALQESLNDKIRAAKLGRIDIVPFENGQRSPQALGDDRNPGGIQSISRVVLIGDPAYRPYPKRAAGSGKVEGLIARLSDPDVPRFEALNKIIEMGDEAVIPLIDAMRTNQDWQIPMALGAIGDSRAIGPLIGKLGTVDALHVRSVIAEALQRLTGRDFGSDPEAWKKWWKERGRDKTGA